MDKIVIFDPSIFSRNLGDDIIVDFCNEEISALLPSMIQIKLPTQQSPSFRSLQEAKFSKYKIVFGTNLMSSDVLSYNQWKCDLFKINCLRGAILMGVGWWQYQVDPTFITAQYYKYILHPDAIHSVRDSYTESKMKKMGFENVINTGCPTTWNLTEDFCRSIPVSRSRNVLFTLTDYKPDLSNDITFLSFLRDSYDHLYFWPQGYADVVYINQLLERVKCKIIFVGASLFRLKKFMANTDFDCIGTRLHAGILALNCRKRTMIIAVDNRAAEMKTDINLPVISRGDLNSLKAFVMDKSAANIHIKNNNVKLWRSQFR
jgi:hypothetical protein